MPYRVADLVADALAEAGVPRVYGVIGTSVLDFVDALYDRRTSLPYVTARHEQAAVSMADGEARASARPVAALVHAGPGLLNAMLGLGIAYRDRSPVLLIVGGVRRRLRGTEAWLEVDTEALVKPVSKSYHYIGSGADAAEAVLEAIRQLYRPPRGPVVLEVPEDVWREEAQVLTGFRDAVREAAGYEPEPPPGERVGEVLEALASAEKPLIIVCGEASYSPLFSQQRLLELADRLDAYVAVTGNGRGGCPEDHPRCLGRLGFGGGNTVADRAFEESDAVLVLGGELDDLHTYGYTMQPSGDVYVVSLDPAVEKRPPYYTALVRTDPARFLQALAGEAESRNLRLEKPRWRSLVSELRRGWEAMISEALSRRYRGAANPSRVLWMVGQRLPRKRVVAAGQGMHLVYAYDFIPVYEPRTFLAATQLGSMSFALPAAIGAAHARRDYTVVAVTGDGELMMSVQELETLVREGLPVKLVVLNDNSYRVLYLRQRVQKGGRVYGTTYGNPDFTALAKAFGMKALRIAGDDEAAEKVDAFARAREPVLLEIATPRDDVPPMNIEYALRF